MDKDQVTQIIPNEDEIRVSIKHNAENSNDEFAFLEITDLITGKNYKIIYPEQKDFDCHFRSMELAKEHIRLNGY